MLTPPAHRQAVATQFIGAARHAGQPGRSELALVFGLLLLLWHVGLQQLETMMEEWVANTFFLPDHEDAYSDVDSDDENEEMKGDS